mgnify:CR=1 FL=1
MVGCSTSEVCGAKIGSESRPEVAQQVYFGIAGYDNGLTTEVSFYKLTYTGPGLPGIVEPYFEDSEDFVAGQGQRGVYMSCRSRKR